MDEIPKSPVPSKAQRLLKEGKITQEEYNSILLSDHEYYKEPTPTQVPVRSASHSDQDVDSIPWARLSRSSVDLKDIGGPLVVAAPSAAATPIPRPLSVQDMLRQMSGPVPSSSAVPAQHITPAVATSGPLLRNGSTTKAGRGGDDETISSGTAPSTERGPAVVSLVTSVLKDPFGLGITSPSDYLENGANTSRRRVLAERKAALVQARQEEVKQRQSAKRHEHITKNNDKWKTKILPRWEELRGTKEVDQLVCLGLPTHMRQDLWARMVGNNLQVSEEVYNDCVEQAEDLEKKKRHKREKKHQIEANAHLLHVQSATDTVNTATDIIATDTVAGAVPKDIIGDVRGASSVGQGMVSVQPAQEGTNEHGEGTELWGDVDIHTGGSTPPSPTSPPVVVHVDEGAVEGEGGRLGRAESLVLIEWDLPRTFPTLSFFHDGGPMHLALDRVLKAYAFYRPDIGYVQGMSYVAAVFLLYMDEFMAFVCLANLLNNNRTNLDFYMLHKPTITAYVRCFDCFFAQFLPLLHDHFRSEGISSEMFLLDWYMTVFSKALSLEVAARMWDCYLYWGEVFILRGALGLLRLFATKLASLPMEKILPFLAHVPEDSLTADDLMSNIAQIKVSKKRYEFVKQQFSVKSGSRRSSSDPRTMPSSTTGTDDGCVVS